MPFIESIFNMYICIIFIFIDCLFSLSISGGNKLILSYLILKVHRAIGFFADLGDLGEFALKIALVWHCL